MITICHNSHTPLTGLAGTERLNRTVLGYDFMVIGGLSSLNSPNLFPYIGNARELGQKVCHFVGFGALFWRI
jgi:hypothetical protein